MLACFGKGGTVKRLERTKKRLYPNSTQNQEILKIHKCRFCVSKRLSFSRLLALLQKKQMSNFNSKHG